MNFKKSALIALLLLLTGSIAAQTAENKKYTLLLTGASFAVPVNGWFELGCRKLDATPINRAVSGESIASTANKMEKGTLYSREELEDIDALVIMHVHDRDVYDESQLKENYTDYKTPFDYRDYAQAYDYVIKRYMTECYELRNDSTSKYFNTSTGKPAVIVLCTHWNDARVTYNEAVRKLAAKWGLPLVEFDKYIGFSKNEVHPVTKQQISLIYSGGDSQTVDGVKYGYRTEEYEGLHNMYKKSRSEGFGPEVKRRIMLGSFVLSSGYYDAYYLKALKTKALIKKAFDKAFEKYDVIVAPAAPTTAPELGKSLNDPIKMYLGDIYTISVNLAGLPGITIPVGKDSKGLPVGMQLIGNCFEENKIIQTAYTFEQTKAYEAPELAKEDR